MRSLAAPFFSVLATMVLFFAISRLIYTQPTATSRLIDRPQLTLLKELKTNNSESNNQDTTEPPQQNNTIKSYPGVQKPLLRKSDQPSFKPNFSMKLPTPGDELSFFNGPFIGDPSKSTSGSQALTPLIRIPPIYPRRAAAKGIEGWVKLEFTVLATGDVTDVTILKSKPKRIFNRAAIKAISSWKFKPKVSNGKAISQRATQTITFKLSK